MAHLVYYRLSSGIMITLSNMQMRGFPKWGWIFQRMAIHWRHFAKWLNKYTSVDNAFCATLSASSTCTQFISWKLSTLTHPILCRWRIWTLYFVSWKNSFFKKNKKTIEKHTKYRCCIRVKRIHNRNSWTSFNHSLKLSLYDTLTKEFEIKWNHLTRLRRIFLLHFKLFSSKRMMCSLLHFLCVHFLCEIFHANYY